MQIKVTKVEMLELIGIAISDKFTDSIVTSVAIDNDSDGELYAIINVDEVEEDNDPFENELGE